VPEWVVHLYTGEKFCGISRRVYSKVNEFIDSNPLGHDVNRVIVNGHWIPEALLYLTYTTYDIWGCEGVKAVLHHNLLDYCKTLITLNKRILLYLYYGIIYEGYITEFVHKVLDNIEKICL
jgi:hypothetical protein